jgi:hypothetical protein
MPKQPETIIEWQAPEFRHYPKNAAWFIIFTLVVAVLVIYQITQKDYFGAISIAIIAGFFGAFALHRPKIVTVRISTHGLHIDDAHIPFTHIKQFWIVDTEHHKTLNLETTAYLNHLLTIELNEQDADEVQEILEEILPENPEKSETAVQRISHRVKF